MKLTEFLKEVGRPVAYYPSIKRITGSTTATILLCQFIYWRGKEADPDGWLYKTAEEIEEETGLTYNEQKTARKLLVDAGLLDEHYARLDHKMRFKVNLDTINEKWGTLQPNIPQSDDSTLGNEASPFSLNESETTSETTSDLPKNKKTDEENPVYSPTGATLKIDLEKAGIEWSIAAGAEITQSHIDRNVLETDAMNAFERDMGFGNLPWDSEKKWEKFKKFVVEQFRKDRQVWQKYKEWRNGDGKFKGMMTNPAIRRDPQIFMDSGFPTFLAHTAMYGGKRNSRKIENLDR